MNTIITQNENFAARCQKVLATSKQLYSSRPDWVTFFRETLGVDGAARSVFPSQDEYTIFEQSKEFAEIQTMVGNLRTRKSGDSKNEATKVITVRLPESLHEALKAEASDHKTSMNKLCISKLLQVLVDAEAESQAKAEASAANRDSLTAQTTLLPPAAPASPLSLSEQVAPGQHGSASTSFRSTYTEPTHAPYRPDGRNG